MNAFDAQEDEGAAGGASFLTHIPTILWARRWWIIVPSVLGIIGSIAAVFLIPPIYRSTAIMLVQSSQLSNAIVGDDGSDMVDRRIARIRERATSRPDLVALIERHGLYTSERASKPLSTVIETMRSAIALNPTTPGQPGSRADQQTIAFQLSFDYAAPAPAQAVAQDLMQRILELDAAGNNEQAVNRAQFLSQQAKDLETRITALQGQIASVASRNGSVLAPGAMMLGGSSGSYDVQIAGLQRDNATLLSQKGLVRSADTRDPVVSAAESQLAAARAVYSDNHPDVIAARQRLNEARQLAKSNVAKLPIDTLDQQISFNNQQIEVLRAAKMREQAQISSAMSAASRGPLVQQQMSELQQQLTGLNDQYKSVSDRLLAARAGVRAEDEQMGERLSVVEPPIVPDTPVWPNRLIIAAAGIGGGIGLGLLLAFAIELLLRPIRSPDVLASLLGGPALGLIPVISAKPTAAKASRFAFFRGRSRAQTE